MGLGSSLRKIGRSIDKAVHKIGRSIDDAVHDLGKGVKKLAGHVYKPISAINPVLGLVLGGIAEGKDGMVSALKVGVLSNVALGRGMLDMNAAGRAGEFSREVIKETTKNPKQLVVNTLKNGGDIEKGLIDTFIANGKNLNNTEKYLLKQAYGGTNLTMLADGTLSAGGIDLGGILQQGGFNLSDPTSMLMLYNMVKDIDTPELPTVPELEMITDQTVMDRLNMVKDDLDDATQERINIVNKRMSSRGIKGSIGDELVQEQYEQRDKAIAEYELSLKEEQIKYNNAQKQELYAIEQNNYQMELDARQSKIDALSNIIEQMGRQNSTANQVFSGAKDFITKVFTDLGIINEGKFITYDPNTGAVAETLDADIALENLFGGYGFTQENFGITSPDTSTGFTQEGFDIDYSMDTSMINSPTNIAPQKDIESNFMDDYVDSGLRITNGKMWNKDRPNSSFTSASHLEYEDIGGGLKKVINPYNKGTVAYVNKDGVLFNSKKDIELAQAQLNQTSAFGL